MSVLMNFWLSKAALAFGLWYNQRL
jgi:hypothetical protein